IEWLYRSQQYCGITYAANWMPNYTANAAQICTYYLPGSTASIGGGASLVNGNSRGAFVPESMSMSNWGVNMRGTARVRYIYWSPPINTPTPPPLPPPGTNECAATISISSIEVFSAASVVAIGNGDTQQTPLRTLASGTQVVITAIHPNRQFARITYSVPGTLLTGWIRIRTSATTGTYVNIDAGLCLSDPRNTQSKVESLVNVGETLLSSLFPCTGTYLHDCQPARQYSGLLSSTPLVRIGDFASTSQGCATSRCPNSCGLWTTTATENLHCGTDFVITGDNPPNPNADRTTYVATVGGTYCYYSDFTHGINVREYMNAVSGKLTAGWYIWQYQFTHFDASTDRFTNNFYVAAGTTLGSYQQVGSSDQPHVHVVIKLFADDYDENLCSTGNGVTYLDWENPTSTIIFP
ncbi:MAG: hypothetical protein SF123_17535, partial [Chloroflexota bacterium]|nr:hypothetical protein [Chloroflexota bacterium]